MCRENILMYWFESARESIEAVIPLSCLLLGED